MNQTPLERRPSEARRVIKFPDDHPRPYHTNGNPSLVLIKRPQCFHMIEIKSVSAIVVVTIAVIVGEWFPYIYIYIYFLNNR